MVLLNSGKKLSFQISDYKLLAGAPEKELSDYRLVSGGLGIHWNNLDEDLSLKGFLKNELIKLLNKNESKQSCNTNDAMAS